MRRVLLFTAAWICAAQTPDIHIDVNTVTVAYTVSDRNSAPVKDLRREDFTLLDGGRATAIRSFWQESSLPLTIGLVADVSGSQMGVIRSHRDTILHFLSQVMGPQDKAFIVTVANQVKLVTDLTGSLDELRAGVDELKVGGRAGTQLGEPCTHHLVFRLGMPGPGCGGTILWDGVYAAALLKMKPLTGRKALIVLTDGLDTGSMHNLGYHD
jgi:VWFA-related protein